MSLLHRTIFNSKCRSTHHRIAIDALRHLNSPNSAKWANVLLKNYDTYLDGSKAPDTKFKDFKNHVLHVQENYWGGAVKKSNEWYEIALDELKARRWRDFAYAAGVLSHYFSDPMMPFHTGQSERESVIHRAAEWSITQSYCELQTILESDLGGYPDVTVPEGDNWLGALIIAGAERAHAHYETIIDHYDFEQGRNNPPAGLDQECKDRVAEMIGISVVGFARVLDKLISDAEVKPPMTPASTIAFLESLTVPVYWLLKKIDNAKDRAVVQAMWNELQRTGRVIESLPEDDKCVRAMHAKEVLKPTVGPK